MFAPFGLICETFSCTSTIVYSQVPIHRADRTGAVFLLLGHKQHNDNVQLQRCMQ